jgi:cyclic beta-1,2-glucan synthetase
VRAYQRVQPLTIGELWAVAITLRIVLVENLRRGAERLVTSRADRASKPTRSPTAPRPRRRARGQILSALLLRYAEAPLARSFAVQLVQRLRDLDPDTTPALALARGAARGPRRTTGDELVRAEHQRQGAMNVTVRNIITSMRRISAVDWPDLVERVSLVDARLRPAATSRRSISPPAISTARRSRISRGTPATPSSR